MPDFEAIVDDQNRIAGLVPMEPGQSAAYDEICRCAVICGCYGADWDEDES